MGRHSLEAPGRKRKDLDATKLDWLDVATKVIVGLRVKMCVWLGVSRGLDLAFLNAD